MNPSREKHPRRFREIGYLALAFLYGVALVPGYLAAGEDGATNPPPRLRLVVLPFDNATGSAAVDDWRFAFASWLRWSLEALESVKVPDRDATYAALKREGWESTRPLDDALARRTMGALNANRVLWGTLRGGSNDWRVEAFLLDAGTNTAAVPLQLASTRRVELAERLTRRVAETQQRRIIEEDLELWRQGTGVSDPAADLMAKAIALATGEAPVAEQEQAWRDLLATDPRCAIAYLSLGKTLEEADRGGDAEKLYEELLRQCPQFCMGHAVQAWMWFKKGERSKAEAEVREAFRLHRGCPQAARALFGMLQDSDRPADLIALLRAAHAARPDDDENLILLAGVLGQTGEWQEAGRLLDRLDDLPEPEVNLDLVLLQAAARIGATELAGRELLRLGPQAHTNEAIASAFAGAGKFFIRSNETGGYPVLPRPRVYSAGELEAELGRRLSAEERRLVVNPLEVTPALAAEAQRLTVGITNHVLQSFALFAEVSSRGRGQGDGGQRTADAVLKDAQDAEVRFSCQEHAKLFVALARAVGIEAYVVHVERCADGSQGNHDCAAVFLDGQGVLVDPTWRAFGILHQDVSLLDDVQAISHQAMQWSGKPDARRLRMGLRLNPEDRWTRLKYVRGMALIGDFDAAKGEWERVRGTGADGWDVWDAAGVIETGQEHWAKAREALERACALNPDNAAVHGELAEVYWQLDQPKEAHEHTEAALRLNRGEITRESGKRLLLGLAVSQAMSEAQAATSRDAVRARAEAGDLAAQMAMAKACFGDKPPRVEEGQAWCLKAAEQGNADAQFSYARNLLQLVGERAAGEAVKWLTQAAEQGKEEAQELLARVLYEGKGVAKDEVTAARWAYLAARQNSAEAKRLLQEMELFMEAADLARARKEADSFKAASPPGVRL